MRFVRPPHLFTRAGGDAPAVLSRWLDQITSRRAPGDVLAGETHDVRVGDVLQPVGRKVCRALRQRRGLRLKEIIAVVPAEDTTKRSAVTDPLTITHR